MSDRFYLLNSNVPSSDYTAMAQAKSEGWAHIIEVAEGAYCIPIPWYACFRPGDLRAISVSAQDMDGNKRQVTIPMPLVEIDTAIHNLEQSLPLFCACTGESELATEFWQAALDGLRQLKLPYLALDLNELVGLYEEDEFEPLLRAALSGDSSSLQHMHISYTPGVLPFSLQELHDGADTQDEQRLNNAIALDCGIYEGFVRARPGPPAAPPGPAPSAAGLPTANATGPTTASGGAPDARPGPTCPHCGFRIFNPRCAHCESCGRSLSAPAGAAPIVRPPVEASPAGAHNKKQEIPHSAMGSDPSTFNHKGFGFALYGKTDYEAESGSFLRTHYLVAFHLPLLPLGRYRVYSEGKQHDFIAKVPLRGLDRLHSAVFVLGLIVLYIYMKILRT